MPNCDQCIACQVLSICLPPGSRALSAAKARPSRALTGRSGVAISTSCGASTSSSKHAIKPLGFACANLEKNFLGQYWLTL
eukprot:2047729-Rhodomonas_salina.2